MSPYVKRTAVSVVWRQLPFFVWLVAVWLLLWGQFTVLAAVTGIIVALFVTVVFRLPPVELSGRVNVLRGAWFILTFVAALVRGSLTVAWQVINPARYPGTAIIAVPLRTNDDLIMTHVAVTASLIPGSLIIDIDRDRRILYLHVIGVHTDDDVRGQRAAVLRWEARIVKAVGSREQVQLVTAVSGPSASGTSASGPSASGGGAA